ncbi:MAG: pentapeptide repeat-containing protein [Bacteroidetes bacterium]|nr:pentapeptide repeat-containing protein [Bacteroidota bacterium]
MALSNKPKKSLYQVGEIVYVLNGVSIASGKVVKVSSSVSNPLNDTNGLQENLYYIEGFVQPFKEGEVFHSKNALLFKLKGEYLGKWENSDNISIAQGTFFGSCDFSYVLLSEDAGLPNFFSGIDFTFCNFDGAKLDGATFSGSNLSNSSFRFAKLQGSSFGDANISSCDFRNTNLSSCGLPANADTKSSFKSVVGTGNWDPDTTIWTDGLPIGS